MSASSLVNPFRESFSSRQHPEPCVIVIFGATGNLSRLKLMPALYHLECAEKLTEQTRILFVGRRDWTREYCLQQIHQWVEVKARGGIDEVLFERFAARIDYFKGDLTEAEMYKRLEKELCDALIGLHGEA